MNVPNALSVSRLVLVPVMLACAWAGARDAVVVLLAVSFATDVADGWLARWLGQTSELGARLDSIGDFAVYLAIPVLAWLAWPALLAREALFFAAAVAAVVLPPLLALARFRAISSYHTWAVKLAAALTGAAVLVMFATGESWPFRLAVPVSVLAALEEAAITLVLPAPRANVRSLWDVLRTRPRR